MAQSVAESELRAQAAENIQKRDGFGGDLITYLAFQMWFIILWALGGGGFFWPAFPMLGWGMWVFIHAWVVLTTPDRSEARIEREVARLKAQK